MATETSTLRTAKPVSIASALIPLALGVLILAIVFGVGIGNLLPASVPPAEDLFIVQTTVVAEGFVLKVINSGAVPLAIAQVTVDEAYWVHTVEPTRELEPLERATIRIPYPWVEGEAHEIVVLTHTGTDFGTTVDIAVAAPTIDGDYFLRFAAVGILVGVLPVALGMSFLPYLRSADAKVARFVLALTLGLLAFLAIDAIEHGFEAAGAVPPVYNPITLFVLAAAAAFFVILGFERFSRRRGTSHGLALATMIAVGIGVHNFGEGLAIGSAWASNALAFGTFLVVGFTLHNVTEGPAILAPALKERVTIGRWLVLLAIGGLPAVLGAWVGGATPDPTTVLAFTGLGLGAIVVVLWQVAGHMRSEDARALTRTETLVGFAAGMVVMWITGLFVAL